MCVVPSTDWRNGSASDSSPEGYAFESRIGHNRSKTVHPRTQACRRNTKKEKRQRNQENMRKFKKGAPPTARGGGGKKKTMSRKKLTLKAQAAVEKGREATFMSKLFLATGGALEEKLDLGVL